MCQRARSLGPLVARWSPGTAVCSSWQLFGLLCEPRPSVVPVGLVEELSEPPKHVAVAQLLPRRPEWHASRRVINDEGQSACGVRKRIRLWSGPGEALNLKRRHEACTGSAQRLLATHGDGALTVAHERRRWIVLPPPQKQFCRFEGVEGLWTR